MLQESILQYFLPSLSYLLPLRHLFLYFRGATLDRFYCILISLETTTDKREFILSLCEQHMPETWYMYL